MKEPGDAITTVIICLVLLGSAIYGLVTIGGMDLAIGKQLALQLAATQFPATTGAVTQSAISNHQDGNDTLYQWDLAYRYNVNGREWTGRRYRHDATSNTDDIMDANQAEVQAYVAKYPADAPVQVFYNPKDPGDALLAPGVRGGDLSLLLVFTPVNIAGLSAVWALWFVARRAFFPRGEAGGVRIIRQGSRLRVRLSVYPPLVMGLAVTGGLSILLMFVVIFPFLFRPPTWVAVATLLFAYGAGIVAELMWRKKRAAGQNDLVIDEDLQTLQLPATQGRKESRTIGFADVASLRVEEIRGTTLKGLPRYSYAPTLYLRDGAATGEKLANWTDDRPKAEAFASWLRDRLRLPPEPAKGD
jgi:Protein of unknown function (DUF3592)